MSDESTDSRISDLERRVAALEVVVGPLPRWSLPTAPSPAKPTSAREFLNEKTATTAVDKALVLAVWLEKSGTNPITTGDISSGFQAAKEPVVSNPSDLLYQNGRRGYMAPTREKKGGAKAWYVTTAGEKFVENGLKP